MLIVSPKLLTFGGPGEKQPLTLRWERDSAAPGASEKVLFRLRVNDKSALTMSHVHGVLSINNSQQHTDDTSKAVVFVGCDEASYLARCIVLIQWLEGDAAAAAFSGMSSALVSKTFVTHAADVKFAVVHCGLSGTSSCGASSVPSSASSSGVGFNALQQPSRPPRINLGAAFEREGSSGSGDFGGHNPSTPRLMSSSALPVSNPSSRAATPLTSPAHSAGPRPTSADTDLADVDHHSVDHNTSRALLRPASSDFAVQTCGEAEGPSRDSAAGSSTAACETPADDTTIGSEEPKRNTIEGCGSASVPFSQRLVAFLMTASAIFLLQRSRVAL